MELYKCKQQVKAQCKYRDGCDGTYSGTDCRCYRDNDGFVPDTADKAKIKQLQADYEQLQRKYTQAMELLGLAVEDCKSDFLCETCCYFDNCQYDNEFKPVEGGISTECYRWQHADKLEELKGGSTGE